MSPEDVDLVSKHKWRPLVLQDGALIYARSDVYYFDAQGVKKRKTILMHRIITKCPDKLQVDHGDNDGLNNTRPNLEVCGSSYNLGNRRTYGGVEYRGVSMRPGGRYEAYITDYINTRLGPNGNQISKSRYIGTFGTAIEAGVAYDRKALELYGPFFKLNFPITNYPEYADQVQTAIEQREAEDVPF